MNNFIQAISVCQASVMDCMGHTLFNKFCRSGKSSHLAIITLAGQFFSPIAFLNPINLLSERMQFHYPDLNLGRVSLIPAGLGLFNMVVGGIAQRQNKKIFNDHRLNDHRFQGPMPKHFTSDIEWLDLAVKPTRPTEDFRPIKAEIDQRLVTKIKRLGKTLEHYLPDLVMLACTVSYVAMIAMGFTLTGGIGLAGVALSMIHRLGYLPTQLIVPFMLFSGTISLLYYGGMYSFPGLISLGILVDRISAYLDQYRWFHTRLPQWALDPTKDAFKKPEKIVYHEEKKVKLNHTSIFAEPSEGSVHQQLQQMRERIVNDIVPKHFHALNMKISSSETKRISEYVQNYFWCRFQTATDKEQRQKGGSGLFTKYLKYSMVKKISRNEAGSSDLSFLEMLLGSGRWIGIPEGIGLNYGAHSLGLSFNALMGMQSLPLSLSEQFYEAYSKKKIIKEIAKKREIEKEEAKKLLVEAGVLINCWCSYKLL